MKMVEHIDRLTFGPSLNESENHVNNFFPPPALSHIYQLRGAFLSLASRKERWARVTQKNKKNKKLCRSPRWDGSLIHRIYFSPPLGKELESSWTPQISSFKCDSSTLITSSSRQPFWLKRPWGGTSEKLQAALKYHRGRARRGRANSCQAAIGDSQLDNVFWKKKSRAHTWRISKWMKLFPFILDWQVRV